MLTVRTIYASILAASGALALAAAAPAFAQAIQPQQQVRPPVLPPQQPGNPQTTIPEKIDPPLRKDDTTGSTVPTLSDQLEGSKGVIKHRRMSTRTCGFPRRTSAGRRSSPAGNAWRQSGCSAKIAERRMAPFRKGRSR